MKKPPEKATICSINREVGNIIVNCVGFKHSFHTLADAAAFLDLDWRELEWMLLGTNGPLILFRRQGKWDRAKI